MRKWLLIALGIVIHSNAFAFNLSFLSNAPVSFFTQEDFRMMEDTALKTLNTAKDDVKVTWENPKTQSWGYFIPSQTTTKNGNQCRRLLIFNNANGVTDESDYTFCKFKDGWKVVISQS